MLKVTFNFDPTTNKVSDVSVVDTGSTSTTTPKAKSKTKTKSTGNNIALNGNSLKLNQAVLDLLGVSIGDRVCVSFNPNPVLVRPDIANQEGGGNLITKSMTLSVRGKTGETIAKFGDEFTYNLESEGFLVLKSEATEEVADGEEDKPQEQQIDSSVLDDSDFLSSIEGGEEIDFSFEL